MGKWGLRARAARTLMLGILLSLIGISWSIDGVVMDGKEWILLRAREATPVAEVDAGMRAGGARREASSVGAASTRTAAADDDAGARVRQNFVAVQPRRPWTEGGEERG